MSVCRCCFQVSCFTQCQTCILMPRRPLASSQGMMFKCKRQSQISLAPTGSWCVWLWEELHVNSNADTIHMTRCKVIKMESWRLAPRTLCWRHRRGSVFSIVISLHENGIITKTAQKSLWPGVPKTTRDSQGINARKTVTGPSFALPTPRAESS